VFRLIWPKLENHELVRSIGQRRPSGTAVAVPTKQRVGLDEEAPETLAGEQLCQSGEQRPVNRLECRTADLAAEHRHLVAEHDHLDRQLIAGEPRELDQLADAKEEEVEEAGRTHR